MTVFIRRSPNDALNEGATDGKYRKSRPDTEVYDVKGAQVTENNRNDLHPFWQYGYITDEAHGANRVVPGRL